MARMAKRRQHQRRGTDRPGPTETSAHGEAAQVASPPVPATGLSKLLFRSWTTEFAGHHIRVERRALWVRLVIDGETRDGRLILPGRDAELPIVSAHVEGSRKDVTVVEAFLRGLRLKIMACGRPIGGDS